MIINNNKVGILQTDFPMHFYKISPVSWVFWPGTRRAFRVKVCRKLCPRYSILISSSGDPVKEKLALLIYFPTVCVSFHSIGVKISPDFCPTFYFWLTFLASQVCGKALV